MSFDWVTLVHCWRILQDGEAPETQATTIEKLGWDGQMWVTDYVCSNSKLERIFSNF